MRAQHVVFATTGSLGDLHPFLALGCELKSRGYRVTVATTRLYASNVVTSGLEFCHMRPDPEATAQFHAAFMHPLTGGHFVYADYLAPAIRLSYEDLLLATKDADLLVSQSLMALAAPLVAASTGIRWVSAVFQPMSFFSIYDRPSYLSSRLLQWLCAKSSRVHRKVLHYVKIHTRAWVLPVLALQQEITLPESAGGGRDTKQNLNPPYSLESNDNVNVSGTISANLAIAAQCKLAAQHDVNTQQFTVQSKTVTHLQDANAERHPMFDAQYSPNCVLAMFSPIFGTPQPDWPPQTRQTGQAIYTAKSDELSVDLRIFLQAQPPLIFTLSSAASNDAGNFYSECFKAAQALKLPALLMTGGLAIDTDLPNPLPAWARRVDYAAFAQVFPYAAVIVHAGGIATSFHALCAGKLQVIVPYAHDQSDNAHRLQKLGVAHVIRRAQFNSRSLQYALRALFNNVSMQQKALELAIRARAENGVIKACDIIESTLQNA